MYFDLEPKNNKIDIFDFDREYKQFLEAIKDKSIRIVVISGLRRTGKTSLMNVVFNTISNPKFYIDARKIYPITQKNLAQEIINGLEKELDKYKLFKGLWKRIKEIDFGVRISIEKSDIFLSKIFEEIDKIAKKQKKHFIFMIDEAQVLKTIKFDQFLAYVYDNLSNIKIIVSGSEVGVLAKFLGEEAEAPLFGRAMCRINTRIFEKEEAEKFLSMGFKQVKMKVSEEKIKYAVEKLDGIIGWLSYFGWYSWKKRSTKVGMEETIKVGGKIAYKEYKDFLVTRQIGIERYILIMKLFSEGPKKWSEIKRGLEIKEKKKLSNKQISNYLSSLQDYNFIAKKDNNYYIIDPLLLSAIKLKK